MLTTLCDTSSLLPSLTSLLSNPSLPLDTTRDLLSLVLNLFGTSHDLNLKLLSSQLSLALYTRDYPPQLLPQVMLCTQNLFDMCPPQHDAFIRCLHQSYPQAFQMLSYGLEQGDITNMKLALTTCNTIKKLCAKVETAGGGVKAMLLEVFGKGWRKAARGHLQRIQAKMAQSKKLYDVAVEVEKRWMAPREKEGKELEYHKDFTRIQMMNI